MSEIKTPGSSKKKPSASDKLTEVNNNLSQILIHLKNERQERQRAEYNKQRAAAAAAAKKNTQEDTRSVFDDTKSTKALHKVYSNIPEADNLRDALIGGMLGIDMAVVKKLKIGKTIHSMAKGGYNALVNTYNKRNTQNTEDYGSAVANAEKGKTGKKLDTLIGAVKDKNKSTVQAEQKKESSLGKILGILGMILLPLLKVAAVAGLAAATLRGVNWIKKKLGAKDDDATDKAVDAATYGAGTATIKAGETLKNKGIITETKAKESAAKKVETAKENTRINRAENIKNIKEAEGIPQAKPASTMHKMGATVKDTTDVAGAKLSAAGTASKGKALGTALKFGGKALTWAGKVIKWLAIGTSAVNIGKDVINDEIDEAKVDTSALGGMLAGSVIGTTLGAPGGPIGMVLGSIAGAIVGEEGMRLVANKIFHGKWFGTHPEKSLTHGFIETVKKDPMSLMRSSLFGPVPSLLGSISSLSSRYNTPASNLNIVEESGDYLRPRRPHTTPDMYDTSMMTNPEKFGILVSEDPDQYKNTENKNMKQLESTVNAILLALTDPKNKPVINITSPSGNADNNTAPAQTNSMLFGRGGF